MTKLLRETFELLEKLPEADQDAIAQVIRREYESQRRWDDLFGRSTGLLEEMADEALSEDRAGQTQPLDPDRL